MRNALLLHGKPSKEGYYDPSREAQSNEHWFPWLQRQLLLKDILAQAPEWPKPYAPDFEEYLKVFDQFNVNEETILVGHSNGAGFLIRWLSGNDVKVGKVVLVAPSLDPIRTVNGFFEFEIDQEMVKKTKGITVFYSDDDSESIQKSVKRIMESTKGVNFRKFHGMGHFVFRDMGTREFPELLEEVLKEN